MKCEKCQSEWTSRQSITKCPFCGEPFVITEDLESMHQVVKHIVLLYGAEVLLNTNRLVSLVSDFAPEMEKERRLLKVCGEAGIIKEMVASSQLDDIAKMALINKSVQKLESNFMLGIEWAKLGIGFVAAGLGWNVGIVEEKPISGDVTDYKYNGGKFDGRVEQGKPEGKGRFVFEEGHVYEGEFKNGLFHGNGKILWNHGNRKKSGWNDFWKGKWFEGKPFEGCGTYVYSNYEKVTTIPFEKGLQDGFGVVDYDSGKRFSGSMESGKFQGSNCSVTEPDGRILFGEFKDDNLYNGFEFDSENNLCAYYNSGVKKTV